MLVLSRKSGEAIHIGPGIRVSVLDIKGGRVRLGLSAPREVSIRRGELGSHAGGASVPRPTDDCAEDSEQTKAGGCGYEGAS
jgi:carbon storage regulator